MRDLYQSILQDSTRAALKIAPAKRRSKAKFVVQSSEKVVTAKRVVKKLPVSMEKTQKIAGYYRA